MARKKTIKSKKTTEVKESEKVEEPKVEDIKETITLKEPVSAPKPKKTIVNNVQATIFFDVDNKDEAMALSKYKLQLGLKNHKFRIPDGRLY